MTTSEHQGEGKTTRKINLVAAQYKEVTGDFVVFAEPRFFTRQKEQSQLYYIYTYRITIKNNSTQSARLLKRHWHIRDGEGDEEYVYGDGVVGKQPDILPGESYSYISGCPIITPTGNMRGRYQMMNESGHRFSIKIPLFFLRPDLTQDPGTPVEEPVIH